MLYNALYLILLLLELILFMSLAFYVISLIYSWLKGAPYVSTQSKEINEILKKAHLKNGQLFIELGCGDGRVTKTAVKIYKVHGIGVDINPLLIWYSKILSYLQGTKNISFLKKNVMDINLGKADILYIYLFPKLVEKLQDKIFHETKKNVVIISHGFKIHYLSRYLFDIRKGASFTTYYYRIK